MGDPSSIAFAPPSIGLSLMLTVRLSAQITMRLRERDCHQGTSCIYTYHVAKMSLVLDYYRGREERQSINNQQ